jgi:hypothetical protein
LVARCRCFARHAITCQLKPRESFNSGLSEAQIKSGWWIVTTCPVGYVGSVPFLAKNKDIIFSQQLSLRA